MAPLVWHQEGQKKVEYGVDRGVFYPVVYKKPYGAEFLNGVVWNGLVNVEEDSQGGDLDSMYFDSIKYLDIIAPRNYKATLSAYTAPQQFSISLGNKPLVPGFILTRQAKEQFGLSYRTFVGPDLGYKIHLIYNALAKPKNRNSKSIKKDILANPFEWQIEAVPTKTVNYRPTAHYTLDSMKMDPGALDSLEMIIYGTETSNARLPTIDELVNMIGHWDPLLIIPQPTTGLAELVSGTGDLYRTMYGGYNLALPQTRLTPSPIRGLYRLG